VSLKEIVSQNRVKINSTLFVAAASEVDLAAVAARILDVNSKDSKQDS
jgi:hypothetical protein